MSAQLESAEGESAEEEIVVVAAESLLRKRKRLLWWLLRDKLLQSLLGEHWCSIWL